MGNGISSQHQIADDHMLWVSVKWKSCFRGVNQLGVTYHVSAVAGNDDGSGSFDLSDGCLSVAAGVPVVFYEMEVAVGTFGSVCASGCVDIPLTFEGVAPFEFTYQQPTPGGTTTEVLASAQGTATLTACPVDFGVSTGQIAIQPQSLTDATGCFLPLDNVPAFAVEVIPEPETILALTLCPGVTLTVDTVTFSENLPSGTVILENAAASGCDSVVFVDLNFYPGALAYFAQVEFLDGELVLVEGEVILVR